MSGILKGLGAILQHTGEHIGTDPLDSDTKQKVDKTIDTVFDLVKHLSK